MVTQETIIYRSVVKNQDFDWNGVVAAVVAPNGIEPQGTTKKLAQWWHTLIIFVNKLCKMITVLLYL